MSKCRRESDELLDAIFWLADAMLCPTSMIAGSGGQGSYRRLAQGGYLDRAEAGDSRDEARWVWQLTDKGRMAAVGAHDPPSSWKRAWDGKWRMLLFDLPADCKSERVSLWRWLRKNRMGLLQRSVWITPDSLPEFGSRLEGLRESPGNVTIFEGVPAIPDVDGNAAVSRQAWDFEGINGRYRDYLDLLAAWPGHTEIKALRKWKSEEFRAWRAVMAIDPLLPKTLVPDGYLGFDAWKARASLLDKSSRQSRDR
jgi:DNA-binding transcriptional regulator PaaX